MLEKNLMSFTIIKKLLVSLLFLSACNLICAEQNTEQTAKMICNQHMELDRLEEIADKIETLIGNFKEKQRSIVVAITKLMPPPKAPSYPRISQHPDYKQWKDSLQTNPITKALYRDLINIRRTESDLTYKKISLIAKTMDLDHFDPCE